MKHAHSALLLVCLASFLLTGCGSDFRMQMVSAAG